MRAGQVLGKVALATLCVVAVLPIEPASAIEAVTLTASSATVAPGSTVDLTASMPVVGAGTVTQEIVQTIDPTKVKLTGLSDITYPQGWTLSYSTDGTNFSATTPASSAAWAAVRAVKATGNVSSQGSENGYQIATGTASGGTVSLSPGNITASGSGDGFQVFFDPARTRVFNVFHHMTNGAALDCHVIATGATCAGFPFNPGIGATGQYSSGRVVGTKIWIPIYTSAVPAEQSTASFRCVDISSVLSSGGSPSLCATSNVVMATGELSADASYQNNVAFTAFQMIDGVSLSGSNAESKIWGVIARTGNLVCLDTALRAPCLGMPVNGWATQVKGTRFSNRNDGVQTSIVKWGDNIYIKGSTSNTVDGQLVIGCMLASDPTQFCAGFSSTGKNLGANSSPRKVGRLVLLPNTLGEVQGACLLGDTRSLTVIAPVRVETSAVAVRCWDSSGTEFLGPASLSNLVTATFNTGFSEYQFPVQKGSRIYWGNGINFTTGGADYPPRALCWDAALNSGSGGLCANLPAGSASVPPGYITDNYTVVPDPEIDNCIWVSRDMQPNVISVDIVNNVRGCSGAAPVRASFSGNTVVPRMACSATSTAVREWKSFTLTSPAPSANFTAVLSIRSTNGAVIDGWQRVPITAGNALNLSTLDPTVTGATPSFLVDFTVSSGSVSTATAAVQAVGDAPELCLKPTALAVCPTGTGPVTGLSSSSMTATATGSSTNSSNVTTTLSPASTTITVSVATISQCGATLTGTAVLSGTSTGVAGATVTLLDSSGSPVLGSDGQPITTTTAANGTYSFGYLFPGTYKVKFDSITGGATTSTATVTGGGSGSVSALPALDCSTGTISTVEDPAGDGVLRQVTGIPVLTRTSPANLITNGDFTTRPTTSSGGATTGLDIAIPQTVGIVIPGWTSYGGGELTYAKWTGRLNAYTPDGASPANYYFGNNSGWSTSPTFNPTTAFNANGVTQTSYTFTPGYDSYGNNASPVTLSQTIPTTVGRTYRFQFWQASELWGTIPGIAAFNISGYSRTFFKVNNTNTAGLADSWRRYTFEFTATQATTTIAIMSWGHVTGPAAAAADELRLDDVIVNRCASGDDDDSVTSNTTTLAVGTNGVVNATYVVPLAAGNDTSTGVKGAVQTKDLTTNDTAATGNTLTMSSVYLCDDGQSDAACKTAAARTKVVTGVGSYSVNATTGVMTFTPEANYTGTPAPLKYVISDSGGGTTSATYTPTVVPPPTATADTSSGNFGATQTKDLLLNDSAASGQTLSASSVRLCGASETAPNCTQTSVSRTEGVYTLTNGSVSFVPASGYTGTPGTPIAYAVTDSLGQKASSTYTPTVTPPAAPTASPESKTVVPGGSVSFTNVVGSGALASGTGLKTGASGGPCLVASSSTTPSSGCVTSLTTADGSWVINQSTGVAVFTANANVSPGNLVAVSYRVTDAAGQTATALLTPIAPVRPAASADTSTGDFGATQIKNLLTNDTSDSVTSLSASSVRLCGSSETAPNCTQTSVTRTEGVYTLTNGSVSFVPASGYTGTPSVPIAYAVTDALGQKSSSTYTPTVTPPTAPTASADTSSGLKGVVQTVNPLTNDAVDPLTSLVASSVKLCGATETAPACTQTTVTNTAGTYAVDPTTGAITFTPNASFVGVAPAVSYRVADTAGSVASSTYTATVFAPPTASPDTSSGAYGATQSKDLLANDTADASATLTVSSVKLCDSTETAPNCTNTSVIRAEGTYSLTDGKVTFTPVVGFSGTPGTPIAYAVTDSLGQKASSTYTPTVTPPAAPSAKPDRKPVAPGKAAVFGKILGTNALASGTGLKSGASGGPELVCPVLVASACSPTSVKIPNEGTWSLDQTTGVATFTAVEDLSATGDLTPMKYQVTDEAGQTATATLTPYVVPPPTAEPDASAGEQGKTQTLSPLGNDSTGDTSTSFDPSTLKLCEPGETACSSTILVVRGEGRYVVNTNGTVTFTPEPAFTGKATPLTYTVADRLGQATTSSLKVLVIPPPYPSATPDKLSGQSGTTLVFSPWRNDSPGTKPDDATQPDPNLVPKTLRLCGAGENVPKCTATTLTTPDGTYVVDTATGKVTFTHAAGFTGTATQPVTYQVANDWTGAAGIGWASSVLIPTITSDTVVDTAQKTSTDSASLKQSDPATTKVAKSSKKSAERMPVTGVGTIDRSVVFAVILLIAGFVMRWIAQVQTSVSMQTTTCPSTTPLANPTCTFGLGSSSQVRDPDRIARDTRSSSEPDPPPPL